MDLTCQELVVAILAVVVAVCMIALCAGEWFRNRRGG
jgi:hypothetical protein